MGSTTTNTTASSQPWAAQEPYLTSAFSDAQNNYNTNMAQGAYSGNYVAPTNSNQYTAANNEYNNATGALTTDNNNLLSTGAQETSQGYGSANSAVNSLGALAQNNTGSNLVSTGQGITNQLNTGVQAQVNSAMQAANQNAAQSTIPNLYANAAGGGNINSDRTAVAQGVVNQGLQQTAANLAGSLQAQNTQTGLTTAQNLTSQNAGILSSQGSLGASLGSAGAGMTTSGINNAGTIANQAQAGANQVQALDQSNLNNQIQQYQQNQNFAGNQLSQYMGVVGGNNWGSQSTGSSTSNPSLLSEIGGGLGALGGLFSK